VPQPVRYSVTIDSQDPSRVWKKALAYRMYGFHQCKVKVGDEEDITRLTRVRRWMGLHVDLRVDANEAWSVHECQEKFAALVPLGISCVEQPVPHRQLADQAQALPHWPIPVMLDESLTGETDARRAISLGACQLFNLRISKCGGFLPTLRLAALAQANGIGFQLGCHPGETAILSAAGRHWAQVVQGTRYLEGSYDRHLLARNTAKEDITFGYSGRAPCLLKPGLGITILEDSVGKRFERSSPFQHVPVV
jgi:muconate cycloisomerase